MSRVPWHLFEGRQPQAHLVVGAIVQVAGSADGDELAATQYVLKRLVSKQKPAGDYAATVVRDTGRPEVYFAFEDEADARKLAAAVKAKATGSYPGWASQWAFQLDGATVPRWRPRFPRQGRVRGNRCRMKDQRHGAVFDTFYRERRVAAAIERADRAKREIDLCRPGSW
jgi:hypothetical protein